MTDIDDFKEINDTYSHSEGDFVLKKVSDTMKGIVEKYYPKASTGRWGGEEFMILLPDVSTDDAAKLAEILRSAITWIPFSSSRPISMSFGVTSHRKNESIKSTLLRVDQALYAAKAGGKNTVYKT
jgi:diguanylate cyclase (GGDEF)-like protein